MLITIISSVLLSLWPPQGYSEILDEAIYNCPNANPNDIDLDLVHDLSEIEREYFEKFDIPEDLKGMLLAVACSESGYNSRAIGQKGKAKGVMQLQFWWEKKYKIKRANHKEAAKAWMAHLTKLKTKNDKRGLCSKKVIPLKRWLAAWTAVERAASKSNCYGTPKHYKLLQRWRRSIKVRRVESVPYDYPYPDGC